ncbi:unnamed protein product [Parnassius apollo]|uniref:(apollo) hypothetical protein n=1 Tax=Parnassius apollo TaxID=110799 RepID=A0A8S3XPB6_PARAO|nr:unnamed protein product [Parnassius apollo]
MLSYVVVCVLAAVAHAQYSPQVNTTQGLIEGSVVAEGNYYAFYGIHYAGSVSGENRFKAPPPPPTYPGVFHAIDSSVVCAQPTSRGLVGVEDCLTLNIFTPNLTASQPVLVWIQGEEFTTSDPTLHSFKNFMDEKIVVVKINYRLSIFGFLCLGVEQAPGNAGLKDVVQGLKWIKENIARFGGDPNNIVLFGHGSGAAMVDLITLSPTAENLVHKAIVQSGSALSPGAIAYDPVGYAEALGAKLGYTGKSGTELAKLLITTDISLLASALTDFELFNNTALFAPCIENSVDVNNTIVSDAPINILRSGNYSHIPYIAGYTNKEGTIRAFEAAYNQWLDKMQANFEDFIQVDLNITSNTNKTTIINTIREFYFAQRNINMETIEDYLDYHGDTTILVSTIRSARERALTSRAEVRLYEFTYRGSYNSDWVLPQIPLTGVRHGGVLNFLLNYDLKPSDATVMQWIITRYSTFIRTGSPNNANSVQWLPITSNAFNYLLYSGEEVSVNVSVVYENPRTDPHQQRMTFWNDKYINFYKAPAPVSSVGRLTGVLFVVALCQVLIKFL